MAGTVARFSPTLRLQEPVIRVAVSLADRYGVTVQQLIEALVLGCAERDNANRAETTIATVRDGYVSSPAPVVAPEPRDSTVIALSERRQKEENAEPGHNMTDMWARVESLLQRSKAIRARAEAACEMAARVRRVSQEARIALRD